MPGLTSHFYDSIIGSGHFDVRYMTWSSGGGWGSWSTLDTITCTSPASTIRRALTTPSGYSGDVGLGAYSLSGTLYVFVVNHTSGVTSTSTGLTVTETGATYALSSGLNYVITSSDGKVYTSPDFTTWTAQTTIGASSGPVDDGLPTAFDPAGVTITGGVISGLSGMTAGFMVGREVWVNGDLVGVVVSNTTTSITLSTHATVTSITSIIVSSGITATDVSKVDFEGFTIDSLGVAPAEIGLTGMTISPSGVTLVAGVISGLSGLTVGVLVGRKVYVNGVYVGTVVSNTATTITLDTTTTVSTITGLFVSSEMTISPPGVTLVAGVIRGLIGLTPGVLIGEKIYVNGVYVGTVVSNTATTITLDTTTTATTITSLAVFDPTTDISGVTRTLSSGVISGIFVLVANSLIGKRVYVNGVYAGTVVSNTTTTITLDTTTTVSTITELLFATVTTYAPHVAITQADILAFNNAYGSWGVSTVVAGGSSTGFSSDVGFVATEQPQTFVGTNRPQSFARS
jgi:hypothetical protein